MNRRGIGIIVAALTCLVWAQSLKAQTTAGPKILLTWRPQVYVPADYRGRILPTGGSLVFASVEVIDGGGLVNLSGQRIFWYVNDEFIDDGANRQTVQFTLPNRTATNVDLRVQLPDYKGGVLKTVTVPVVQSKVVIEAPFPGNVFSTTALQFRALPYFFNTSNLGALLFSWSVNGEKPQTQDSPEVLHVDFASQAQSGARLDVRLSVTNPRAQFPEGGGDAVSLLFEQ